MPGFKGKSKDQNKFKKSPYHSASLAKYKKKKTNDNRRKRKREKIIVTFDEDARKEYITGFHKRKVQRRIQAHEKLKEQERLQRIQDRAEKREAEEERIAANKSAMRSVVTVYGNDALEKDDKHVESYNDEFTKEQFGRENVTVTTTFGFDNSSDEEDSTFDMLTPSDMQKKYEKLEKTADEGSNRPEMTKKSKKQLQHLSNSQKTKKSKFYSKGGLKNGKNRKRRGKSGGGGDGKKQRRVKGRSKHSRAGKKLRGKRK